MIADTYLSRSGRHIPGYITNQNIRTHFLSSRRLQEGVPVRDSPGELFGKARGCRFLIPRIQSWKQWQTIGNAAARGSPRAPLKLRDKQFNDIFESLWHYRIGKVEDFLNVGIEFGQLAFEKLLLCDHAAHQQIQSGILAAGSQAFLGRVSERLSFSCPESAAAHPMSRLSSRRRESRPIALALEPL